MNEEEVGPESALQSREPIYRAILDMIPDGLTQMEGERVTFISERACEIFGYPRDQLSSMNELQLIAPEDLERVKDILENAASSGHPLQELEFWIARPDGERRYIRNRYTSLPDAEGVEKTLHHRYH
jgi:PAS domain S-box-containing protein